MKVLINSMNSFYVLGVVHVLNNIFSELNIHNSTFYFGSPKGNQPDAIFLSQDDIPSTLELNSYSKQQQVSILLMKSTHDLKLTPVRWHYIIHRSDRVCDVNLKLKQASVLLNVIRENYFLQEGKIITKLAPMASREKKVIEFFGRGYSPSRIASILDVHVKTVSHHKRSVMRKLNMSNNCEFYRYAINFVNESFEKKPVTI